MTKYKIMYNEHMAKLYYVAKRLTTFWKQCSKNYTFKRFAKRAINKLIEQDKQMKLRIY